MSFRASQRGGPVHLSSCQSFAKTLTTAEGRINSVINSKIESFFELAEYNWMPARPQSTSSEPSTYVFEMITFLTAYVDSVLIGLNDAFKTRSYQSALSRINRWMMVRAALYLCLTYAGDAMWKRDTEIQRSGVSKSPRGREICGGRDQAARKVRA